MKLPCLILLLCLTTPVEPLHIKGKWHSGGFFNFLTRFGFQQTVLSDKSNTQGYVYGNITSPNEFSHSITLVVVDSEYFLEYYRNRTFMPRDQTCSRMFTKIDSIAWESECEGMNAADREDFLRKVPCPKGSLCEDEDKPEWVIPGWQFTYRIEDTTQPRFWYISMVNCYQNTTDAASCHRTFSTEDIELDFDLWLVNGHPLKKHYNPFEHQFSFEMHDVFEIYLAFFIAYCFLLPVQFYALTAQKHMLPFLLTTCMLMEFVGIVFNLIHVFKFAFDGQGVDLLKVVGNFIDNVAQCLFMLLLLLIVKGWTITRMDLAWKSRAILFTVWTTYTLANMGLFIWNLMEVDVISDKDEWQTWPGYIILTFRIGIMVWFLIELRDTFHMETSPDKNQFYLHFGAGFLVWFVYLPIVALILTQISALWRFKTLLSVVYSADFLSFCVMVHLLWPSRSKLYFNLKVRARLPLEELEFSDLSKKNGYSELAMSDDESDQSQELFDARIIRKKTAHISPNGYVTLQSEQVNQHNTSRTYSPDNPAFEDSDAEDNLNIIDQENLNDQQSNMFNRMLLKASGPDLVAPETYITDNSDILNMNNINGTIVESEEISLEVVDMNLDPFISNCHISPNSKNINGVVHVLVEQNQESHRVEQANALLMLNGDDETTNCDSLHRSSFCERSDLSSNLDILINSNDNDYNRTLTNKLNSPISSI